MTWISYEFSSWYCLLYLRISTFCIHLWCRKPHRPIKHQWVYCPTRCFGVNHSERCTVCWSWGNIEWGEHTTWALLTFWLLQHFGQSTLKFCLPWASHGLLLFCFSWQMTCPIGKWEWKDTYPATKSTCPGQPDSPFFKPCILVATNFQYIGLYFLSYNGSNIWKWDPLLLSKES